jgi:hypothetical protein
MGNLSVYRGGRTSGPVIRGRARQKAKNFFRSVLMLIVCCVWVLFCFGALMASTNDSGYSGRSELAFSLCMLAMAVPPYGFVAVRLFRSTQ